MPPPPPVFDSYPRAGPGPATEEREEHRSNSNRGTRCELKQLDGRYDNRGNYTITDSSVSMLSDDVDAEPHAEYALVSTRVYGPDGIYQSTQLEIKSRLIKKALRKVIKFYPGQPVDTSEVIFNDPPKPLFHYRRELEDYKHTKADDETKKHLDLMFKFVDSLIGAQGQRFRDLTKIGLITFPLIWMLFKPGDTVYTEKDGHPQAMMISQIEPSKSYSFILFLFMVQSYTVPSPHALSHFTSSRINTQDGCWTCLLSDIVILLLKSRQHILSGSFRAVYASHPIWSVTRGRIMGVLK
jgi:hypothetical protein